MRIVFMGTPDFAAETLKALLQSGEEIAAVVTQPDKPVGRKAILQPSPVKVLAEEAGVPVLQPRRVRDEEAIDALRAIAPDLIVVAAFGQIIPKEILEMPPLGCVNVHASLLPKYRGAAPIQWALLDGEEETGITLMRMDEGLDTGDILAVRTVPVTGEDTGGSLFDKMASAGAKLLLENLEALKTQSLTPQPQPEESPTAYARMIKKEDGRIDWTREAAWIERQIRAMSPWPSAFTSLNGKNCKILRSHLVLPDETNTEEHDTIFADASAGTIVSADPQGIRVRTGKGILCVTELQLEGKKALPAADFLRGHPLGKGDTFC